MWLIVDELEVTDDGLIIEIDDNEVFDVQDDEDDGLCFETDEILIEITEVNYDEAQYIETLETDQQNEIEWVDELFLGDEVIDYDYSLKSSVSLERYGDLDLVELLTLLNHLMYI